jgi:hypothetical protein
MTLRLFGCRVVQYFVEIYGFAINNKICGLARCGLAHLRNLLICNIGMSPRIFGLVWTLVWVWLPTSVQIIEIKH